MRGRNTLGKDFSIFQRGMRPISFRYHCAASLRMTTTRDCSTSMAIIPEGHGAVTRATPPDPLPGGAPKICVPVRDNYEEGGEKLHPWRCRSRSLSVTEVVGANPLGPVQAPLEHRTHVWNIARARRLWRLHQQCSRRPKFPSPSMVVPPPGARARRPTRWRRCRAPDGRIATHGLRWIDYRDHSGRPTNSAISWRRSGCTGKVTGERPHGIYLGRTSRQFRQACGCRRRVCLALRHL